MTKDEKKMIEEMARIICKGTSNEGFCEKCDFKKHEQFGYTYQCRKFDEAEALYNANCRIVADDEIVESMKTYERARQETAREILQELYDEAMRNTKEVVELTAFEIKQLAKGKGIELED